LIAVRVVTGGGPRIPRIGFVGIGRMGLPMCANLVRAGYRVMAGDSRPECEDLALGCGARWSPATAEVAVSADVLITMLPGPREVRDAMLDSGGALDALPAGAAWIDMTGNSPAVAGFELSDLVHRTYQRALARYGALDGELLAVALLEEQAGVRLRDG
jgi:hypothetical protein